MLPVEILINEHQLILQMVKTIRDKKQRIVLDKRVDPNFIVTTVDFFRTYADKYHHGKEEGILFNELSQKALSDVDEKIMRELIMEHAYARRTVNSLELLKESFLSDSPGKLDGVLQMLDTLVELYPKHIEKEDEHFFYPSMLYFNQREQEEMLDKFVKFDQDFTNKRYRQTVVTLHEVSWTVG
jgi:hemerythrin-like domain-containing protein